MVAPGLGVKAMLPVVVFAVDLPMLRRYLPRRLHALEQEKR